MQEINKLLTEIEKTKGIKILFAIEAGSRVWRMASKDSDYDVRFVYVRPKKDYLRINKQADVIDTTTDNIDIVGFDIYKFTKLLLSSNPSMIEWLKSDIIYIDDGKTKELLKKFIEEKFNPIALYHHYRSMCKQNYLKYLKSGEMMTHKKYLYAMRGLVNAKYVMVDNKIGVYRIPPIDFNKTIKKIFEIEKEFKYKAPEIISIEVLNKLLEIIELKKTGFEKIKVSKIHLFETYIETFLKTEAKPESRRIIDYQEVQEHIFDMLGVKE